MTKPTRKGLSSPLPPTATASAPPTKRLPLPTCHNNNKQQGWAALSARFELRSLEGNHDVCPPSDAGPYVVGVVRAPCADPPATREAKERVGGRRNRKFPKQDFPARWPAHLPCILTFSRKISPFFLFFCCFPKGHHRISQSQPRLSFQI